MKKQPLKLPLTNAYALSVLNPETFERPEDQDIAEVLPGDFVKICYHEEDQTGERFWCEVASIDPKAKKLIGLVANELVCYDIAIGTPIEIEFKEIYDILQKQNA